MLELESLERLGTIIVGPEWLSQVYEAQTDPSDSKMVKIQVDAKSKCKV